MESDIALKIIIYVTLITFIVFLIFAIYTLAKSSKAIEELKDKVSDLSKEFISSTKNIENELGEFKSILSNSLNNLNETSTQIRKTAKVVEDGADIVVSKMNTYKTLINAIEDKVSKPFSGISNYASAISKAVSTFVSFLSINNKKN